MKVRAAQRLLREPYNLASSVRNSFGNFYQSELQEYNHNEIGVCIGKEPKCASKAASNFGEDDPNDFNAFIEDADISDGSNEVGNLFGQGQDSISYKSICKHNFKYTISDWN